MPYIKQSDRMRLDVQNYFPSSPGDLNYIITTLLVGYVSDKGLSYQTINDIIGALESAKLEFYRRVAVPYEEQKIKDNGDMYEVPLLWINGAPKVD